MRFLSKNNKDKSSTSNLKPVFAYLKPYKKDVLFALLSLLVTSSAILAMGKGLGFLVDKGLNGNNPQLLNKSLLIMLVVIVILAIATFARFYFITLTGEKVISDIRRDIYKKLLTLSPEFYEKTKIGDVLSRVTADCTLIQSVIGSSLSIALRNTIMLIGSFVLLLNTSLKLSSAILIVIPLVLSPIILIGRNLRKASRNYQEQVALISSNTEETLSGIKTIQSFVRESSEINKFNKQLINTLSSAKFRIFLRSILTTIVIILVFSSIGFVLWIGGHDVLKGKMSAGDLSSFIFYSVIMAGGAGALSEVMGELNRAAGAAERIFELLGTETKIVNNGNDDSVINNRNITFKNVYFSYPSKPNILSIENLSLNINQGETTAIVGHSGAGKTTIINLLLRFYDIKSGDILIDQTPIKDIDLAKLRLFFGLVPQDPVIFSGNVYDNILIGNPDAGYEDVKQAAKNSSALEFIENLAEGFDSQIGEKGIRLSGGERQRIAIARMFLKNPDILLLDEATSALDVENELKVQQALDKLMQNRTTIVIAHRLSTVKKADKIVVMTKGKISEIGSHDELMKNSGSYAKLVQMQFK